jgi:hypothetical protein
LSDDIVPISTSNKTFGSKSHFYDLETGGDIYRTFDTEVQLIRNFLMNHWNSGDEFTITIRSSLVSCSSCKEHLSALRSLGKRYSKKIDFVFEANPKARQIVEFNNLRKK